MRCVHLTATVLMLSTALIPVHTAAAAPDAGLIFASKVLAADRRGAIAMIYGNVGLSARMPAIEGRVDVSPTEFFDKVSRCSILRIEDRSVGGSLTSGPSNILLLWDCIGNGDGGGFAAYAAPVGDKVIVSDFGKTYFAPPPPPAER